MIHSVHVIARHCDRTMKVMKSHMNVDTQYDDIDTPLIICRCFTLVCRSRTIHPTTDAGKNANAMPIINDEPACMITCTLPDAGNGCWVTRIRGNTVDVDVDEDDVPSSMCKRAVFNQLTMVGNA